MSEIVDPVERWLTYKVTSEGGSTATAAKYLGYVMRLREFLAISKTRLLSATADQLIEFTGIYLHKAGLAPGSRKAVVAAVKGFYQYALDRQLITSNPAQRLEYPSIGRKVPLVMQLRDAEKLLMQPDVTDLQGLRDAAILALLMGCGMRVSGLCRLNESSLFVYNDATNRERVALRLTEKGGHERTVPVPQEAAILLMAYLGHADLVAVDRSLPNGDSLVFVSFMNRRVPEHEYRGENRRLSQKSVWRLIQKYAERAGIPLNTAHPHALRHLVGTEMAESDATLLDMQAQLGHVDANATAIYAQVALRKRTSLMDKANPLAKIRTPVSSLLGELEKARVR